MKRKFTVMATAVLLSSSIMFSSCIGSFTLFNKVLSWNQSVGDKWINELVFLVLWAVPVYEIAFFIDGVVLNSIEFWTGENPASAEVQVKQVETKNGLVTITKDANGYQLQKEGDEEIVEFRFNKAENSWSLEAMGETTPLLQFTGENQAKVYLADGSTMTVTTDQAGVLALKQALDNAAFFAGK
jgi:hypothetical protein